MFRQKKYSSFLSVIKDTYGILFLRIFLLFQRKKKNNVVMLEGGGGVFFPFFLDYLLFYFGTHF